MSSKSPDIAERLILTRVVCHQDRRALATLYLKYHKQIESYIASYISSATDTEDLAQEVFIQLCAGKGHYDGRTEVKSYLLGIARNIIRRYYRRKRKISSSETVFIRSIDTIRPGYDIHQQFERITEDAITRLHPKERQAIRLRFVEGLGPKEAAKKAGCSIGAFYKRLERAEKAMREAVKNKKD